MPSPTQSGKITFDVFEVDLKAEELWRGARKVRCQRQPFRVLAALLEQPGVVISREELQLAIWGENSPADADHSLGIAVNKLREALGDSAETPRFVETLSRRGYRFIAPIDPPAEEEETAAATADSNSVIDFSEQESTVPDPLAIDPRFSEAGSNDRDETALSPDESQLGEPVLSLPIVVNGFGGSEDGVPATLAQPLTAVPVETAATRSSSSWLIGPAALAGLLLIGMIAGLLFARFLSQGAPAPRRIDQVTQNDSIFPGVPAMESFPVLASDGSRVYSSILENGQTDISSIDTASGAMERLQLPSEIVNPTLGDISPDGTRLLLRSRLSSNSEQPVWVVPRTGGSAQRVGDILAHDAVWMPDGERVLYAAGNSLDVIRLRDGVTTHLATLTGRAFWMRWSPDGRLLRFTQLDPLTHTSSLWQLDPDGRAKPLLQGWSKPPSECCGVWTSDGKTFVFESGHDGGSDLWTMRGAATGGPQKLTNGPLSYTAPMVERGTNQLYFVGLDLRSDLQRYDQGANRFVLERDFFSDAWRVTTSRDRKWIAWTDGSGRLWRARASDGTEKVQLTPDNLEVFLAHWSPDGRHLLAMARADGQSWQMFLVSADGGTPERLLQENRNEADPTWSSDGTKVAFGRVPDLMGRESGPRQIEVLDLATRQVEPLPGSEGLFSPRWSPDGRWIAALTFGDQRLMLYDTETRLWHAVGSVRASDPVWSANSTELYIHDVFSQPQRLERVNVQTGTATTIATLSSPLSADNVDYIFVGLTPAEAPLVRVRTATGNLYTLNLDRRGK